MQENFIRIRSDTNRIDMNKATASAIKNYKKKQKETVGMPFAQK